MYATRLKGQITRDRRLIIEIPRDVTAGAVEVILLQVSDKPKRTARRDSTHPAFGIWAERTDIADTVSFATEIRRRVEMRADGNPSK
ncbi:MAG: hypothetical protein ABII13_00065 [Patescibacteria group bacterium]